MWSAVARWRAGFLAGLVVDVDPGAKAQHSFHHKMASVSGFVERQAVKEEAEDLWCTLLLPFQHLCSFH